MRRGSRRPTPILTGPAGAILNFPAEALPGLICAFRLKADGTTEELAVDHPIVEEPGGSLWLHFNLADARAVYFLRTSSYFPAPARELLVAADDHQQLSAIEGCLFGIFPDLVCEIDGTTDEIGFLHFAMTEALLSSLSVSRASPNACSHMRALLRSAFRRSTNHGNTLRSKKRCNPSTSAVAGSS
jgi:hypothetical protein